MAKLNKTQMIVDKNAHRSILLENEKILGDVRQEIEYQMLGNELVAHRIKEQCWDEMKEKLHTVKAIKHQSLSVSTFAIKHTNQSFTQYFRKMKTLLQLSQMEHAWSRTTQDKIRSEFDEREATNSSEIDYVWDINQSKQNNQTNQELYGKLIYVFFYTLFVCFVFLSFFEGFNL